MSATDSTRRSLRVSAEAGSPDERCDVVSARAAPRPSALRAVATAAPSSGRCSGFLASIRAQRAESDDGTSGRILVRSAGSGGLSGEFESVLRRQGTTDTLRIRGTFAGVPVTQAQPMCGRAAKPGN